MDSKKPSKVTALYYSEYPNCSPVDKRIASSETTIEVGDENCDVDSFWYAYSINVATLGYVNERISKEGYFAVKNLVVVAEFTDEAVLHAIESLLPRIHEVALRLP